MMKKDIFKKTRKQCYKMNLVFKKSKLVLNTLTVILQVILNFCIDMI